MNAKYDCSEFWVSDIWSKNLPIPPTANAPSWKMDVYENNSMLMGQFNFIFSLDIFVDFSGLRCFHLKLFHNAFSFSPVHLNISYSELVDISCKKEISFQIVGFPKTIVKWKQ